MNQSCRFCYSYQAPGFIQPCCPPIRSATLETLASISSSCAIVNNNIYNSSQPLLYSRQKNDQLAIGSTIVASTLASLRTNASSIQTTLSNQLSQVQAQRYTPFQPYIYPVIPSSVTQLIMLTANTGNRMQPVTNCTNAKGSQFVTK